MNTVIYTIALLIVIFIVFFILCFVINKVIKFFNKKNHRYFDLKEYLPEEEISTLRQVAYLSLMLWCFAIIVYSFLYRDANFITFAVLEIIISAYIVVRINKESIGRKLLVFLIFPYGSLVYFILLPFPNSYAFLIDPAYIISILDFLHIIGYLYLMKMAFDKFRFYTEANGLGVSILLLFVIIFVSFILTMFTEHVDPIDSINMVSNAFTSNGYAILGKSSVGKVNAIVLVWGGYILSGVSTATLAAGIVIRHFNKKFNDLEELIKKNNED